MPPLEASYHLYVGVEVPEAAVNVVVKPEQIVSVPVTPLIVGNVFTVTVVAVRDAEVQLALLVTST